VPRARARTKAKREVLALKPKVFQRVRPPGEGAVTITEPSIVALGVSAGNHLCVVGDPGLFGGVQVSILLSVGQDPILYPALAITFIRGLPILRTALHHLFAVRLALLVCTPQLML
jgi:hypothetical protein